MLSRFELKAITARRLSARQRRRERAGLLAGPVDFDTALTAGTTTPTQPSWHPAVTLAAGCASWIERSPNELGLAASNTSPFTNEGNSQEHRSGVEASALSHCGTRAVGMHAGRNLHSYADAIPPRLAKGRGLRGLQRRTPLTSIRTSEQIPKSRPSRVERRAASPVLFQSAGAFVPSAPAALSWRSNPGPLGGAG